MSMAERYLSESSVLQAVGDVHPLDYNGQGIVERIKAIPAADVVERKPGRWIHYDDKSYAGDGYEECSCCGWKYSDWIFIEDSKFCPNCGAKMYGGPDA